MTKKHNSRSGAGSSSSLKKKGKHANCEEGECFGEADLRKKIPLTSPSKSEPKVEVVDLKERVFDTLKFLRCDCKNATEKSVLSFLQNQLFNHFYDLEMQIERLKPPIQNKRLKRSSSEESDENDTINSSCDEGDEDDSTSGDVSD